MGAETRPPPPPSPSLSPAAAEGEEEEDAGRPPLSIADVLEAANVIRKALPGDDDDDDGNVDYSSPSSNNVQSPPPPTIDDIAEYSLGDYSSSSPYINYSLPDVDIDDDDDGGVEFFDSNDNYDCDRNDDYGGGRRPPVGYGDTAIRAGG